MREWSVTDEKQRLFAHNIGKSLRGLILWLCKDGDIMADMTIYNDADLLTKRIAELIENSRKRVVAQVNSTMVRTYFEIGRLIVENEQQGETRAAYGNGLLKELSQRLTTRFGKGFSVDNLENMRRFYQTYGSSISETASRILQSGESSTRLTKTGS